MTELDSTKVYGDLEVAGELSINGKKVSSGGGGVEVSTSPPENEAVIWYKIV